MGCGNLANRYFNSSTMRLLIVPLGPQQHHGVSLFDMGVPWGKVV